MSGAVSDKMVLTQEFTQINATPQALFSKPFQNIHSLNDLKWTAYKTKQKTEKYMCP